MLPLSTASYEGVGTVRLSGDYKIMLNVVITVQLWSEFIVIVTGDEHELY